MPTHRHSVDKTNTSIDCDSLLPNYEAEPQTSAPPYIIAVSFDNFEPGNEVQVTLEALGDAGFKGFNLQAREIDGDVPVGTFKITDPNTKGLECHNMTNSAVINANSDVKQKVTTTWIAPQDVRELQFIATVVQNLENFWVGIQSKSLTPTHSESVNATGKSKRKLMIELECSKVGPSGSSQNSYSGSQGGVVYTISKSGCAPSASLSGSGLTYGQNSAVVNLPYIYLSYKLILYSLQSVPSSSSDSSKKVVVVANSNPFPPVRHTFPQRTNKVDKNSKLAAVLIFRVLKEASPMVRATDLKVAVPMARVPKAASPMARVLSLKVAVPMDSRVDLQLILAAVAVDK
ncbi:hypothetical protein DV515_00004961 [Chloebia gouldiae]|uniref:Reelin domain-containing protein n=1 Tax=Chloebia gouldiae TaxID=44316 RepID=A0A3L8SQW9_CHLGU|nr:hypothetical protein DV515_00004961 [Chloebia gouldiae]